MEKVIETLCTLAVIAGVILLSAWPVMWIIQYTFAPAFVVSVLGGPITYWKAFWLSWLCSILFKNNEVKSE